MFEIKKIYKTFLICNILNASNIENPDNDNYRDPSASSSNYISPIDNDPNGKSSDYMDNVDDNTWPIEIDLLFNRIDEKKKCITALGLELKTRKSDNFDRIKPLIVNISIEVDRLIKYIRELNDKLLKEIMLSTEKLGKEITINDSYSIILLKDVNSANLEEKIKEEKIREIITCPDLDELSNEFKWLLKINSLPNKFKWLINKYRKYFKEIQKCQEYKNYLQAKLTILENR